MLVFSYERIQEAHRDTWNMVIMTIVPSPSKLHAHEVLSILSEGTSWNDYLTMVWVFAKSTNQLREKLLPSTNYLWRKSMISERLFWIILLKYIKRLFLTHDVPFMYTFFSSLYSFKDSYRVLTSLRVPFKH